MSNEKVRAYSAAHFALELDGSPEVGVIRSIEGGGVKADVMSYQFGQGHDRWRQLGKPKFDDLKLQVGMSMSAPFYEWISAFFDGKAVRKNGAIIAADFYYTERARREFSEALIKEITFPAMSASDRNAAYMGVGVAVEKIVFKKGDGKKMAPASGGEKHKLWTSCNFRFTVDGFDAACRRVSKVESFTIKQTIIEHHVGGQREPYKMPSRVDFPSLVFSLPEADAQPFMDHLAQHAVAGAPSKSLGGTIETLDNAGATLFTLTFSGAEVVSVMPDRSDASSEEFKMAKIELFTEKMQFKYS
jgi:phage tail-like protein